MSERVTDAGCLFCRIVAGEIPATVVHDEAEVLAFRDVNPQSPTHVLVIPKTHIRSVAALEAGMEPLAGRLLVVAAGIAAAEGIAERGYRIASNVGAWGGQSVDHLHLHLMGGRSFSWPPG